MRQLLSLSPAEILISLCPIMFNIYLFIYGILNEHLTFKLVFFFYFFIARFTRSLTPNLPPTLKQYIHRVGRTARAGRSGRYVVFISLSCAAGMQTCRNNCSCHCTGKLVVFVSWCDREWPARMLSCLGSITRGFLARVKRK